MKSEIVLKTIARLEPELRRMGVRSVSLFGSVARGNATELSDVDLLLDVAIENGFSLLDLVSVRNFIADRLDMPVDVVAEPVSDPELKSQIEKDRVRAF